MSEENKVVEEQAVVETPTQEVNNEVGEYRGIVHLLR